MNEYYIRRNKIYGIDEQLMSITKNNTYKYKYNVNDQIKTLLF